MTEMASRYTQPEIDRMSATQDITRGKLLDTGAVLYNARTPEEWVEVMPAHIEEAGRQMRAGIAAAFCLEKAQRMTAEELREYTAATVQELLAIPIAHDEGGRYKPDVHLTPLNDFLGQPSMIQFMVAGGRTPLTYRGLRFKMSVDGSYVALPSDRLPAPKPKEGLVATHIEAVTFGSDDVECSLEQQVFAVGLLNRLNPERHQIKTIGGMNQKPFPVQRLPTSVLRRVGHPFRNDKSVINPPENTF